VCVVTYLLCCVLCLCLCLRGRQKMTRKCCQFCDFLSATVHVLNVVKMK
jgi:hypothetical protein